MELFDALGFRWNRDSVPRQIPRASVERVVFRFHRMLPEYVWDASVLEGNPFTFPEVKTLLEGVTIGGRKLSDQEQILNLAESSKYLLELVKQREFKLDKPTFCALHALVARNEALEWGHFRGEGPETRFTPDVALGDRGRFTPFATDPGAVRLNEVFSRGVRSLEQRIPNAFERATAFFLFGSIQQFFFDGNKRTSRFMMNGLLMTEGIDAVSIPAGRAEEFNSRMVDFYTSRDATEMMTFVLECHPSVADIHQLNPEIPGVRDASGIKYFKLDDSARQTGHDGRRALQRTEERVAHEMTESSRSDQDRSQAVSLEEVQRNASEDWRRKYGKKADKTNQPGPAVESRRMHERAETQKSEPEHDAGLDHDPE